MQPTTVEPVAPMGESGQQVAFVTDASVDVPLVERARAVGSVATWHVLPDTWSARVGRKTIQIMDHGENSRELTRLVLDGGANVVAPDVDTYSQQFDALRGRARVWSVHCESRVTPTIEAARIAARDFPNVRVISTNGAGISVGLLVCRAAATAVQLEVEAEVGGVVAATDTFLDQHANALRFLVVPDHFDPTAPRRIIAAVLLSGRPMHAAPGVELGRGKRLRSRRAAVSEIERQLTAHAPIGANVRMAVGHAEAAGAIDPLLDIVERIRPTTEIDLVGRIGPRISRRVGSSCVGLAWMVE